MKFTVIMITFLGVFAFLVGKGIQKSNKDILNCQSKGGVALTERGVYSHCIKKEYFINEQT